MLKKKRILHMALHTAVGGLERLLVEFARYADRERFDLSFVSLATRGPIAAEIEALGWPVRSFNKGARFEPGLIVRLARHLRRLQLDVVHTHNSAPLLYGVLAAKLARVPRIIHTRHGRSFAQTARQSIALKALARSVDHFVSVSADCHQLSLLQGVRCKSTTTIFNGVDLTRFPYSGPQANGPAILVARLCPEKDVGTLLKATKIVHDTLGGLTLRLQIVGDGAERAGLEEKVRSLELTNVVQFLGERHDVANLLGGASMFVLPSLSEGVSLTLLEAMARGLPVIATCVGGNPEVVMHDLTGLLVPSRDPVALAQAMLGLFADPQLARQLGVQGRCRVEQRYSVLNMVAAYEQLYLGRTDLAESAKTASPWVGKPVPAREAC